MAGPLPMELWIVAPSAGKVWTSCTTSCGRDKSAIGVFGGDRAPSESDGIAITSGEHFLRLRRRQSTEQHTARIAKTNTIIPNTIPTAIPVVVSRE